MPVFEISPQLMQFGRADVELTQESPSIFWGSLCLPEPIFKSLLLLRSGCWWRLRSNYEGQMSGEDTHIHAERGERGDWEEGRKRGEKGGRMDGWRTNQWGAALKKTSERAKQSKAKQYTSEEIMRVTLSCGCDELSVVCRSETSRNDETVCVCVCQCMCVCLKSS